MRMHLPFLPLSRLVINYMSVFDTEVSFDFSMSFLAIEVDWENLSFPTIPDVNFAAAMGGKLHIRPCWS